MPHHSRRNSRNTRAGSQWEARLQWWHNLYLQQGRAYITKRGPPITFLEAPRNGVARCRVEGQGPADYGGVLAGGRAVEFEAKCTTADRWRLELVKEHQGQALQVAHELGALVFVATQTPSGCMVLPWSELGPVWLDWLTKHKAGTVGRGEASLSRDDMWDIGEPMVEPGDWLSVLI